MGLPVALGLALLTGCVGPKSPPSLSEQASQPVLAQEIVFSSWPEDIPEEVFEEFTEKHGIPVEYRAFDSMDHAAEMIREGERLDLVNLDSRLIPALIEEGALHRIDRARVENFKHISPDFRGLVYDPENRYSVPWNWGTTGLVLRSDLTRPPITRWGDLWTSPFPGKVGLWRGEPREVVAMALRSLGYSANSESPAELERALSHLLQLKPRAVFVDDYDEVTSAELLASGELTVSMGWAYDALVGRDLDPDIAYVLPHDGPLLWCENFVIPASSPAAVEAELLLNYLLSPEVAAAIVQANLYATPNEAALALIPAELLADPIVFPSNEDLEGAEVIMPLSPEGQARHDAIWQRFLAGWE